MDGEAVYKPDENDILVHQFEEPYDYAYFSLGTGFGVGKPNYYVTLDENGGARSWWLDPDEAETLGKRLIELAADCQRRNLEQTHRDAEWRARHPDS